MSRCRGPLIISSGRIRANGGVRQGDVLKMNTRTRLELTALKEHAAQAPPARFLDAYLPYLLGHASFAINKDFDRYVQAFGVSPLEWRVLATLSDEDGLTIGDLAHKVVAQQPTLTKAIRKMEEAGLVERRSDAMDMRKTLAHVTAAGRALARKLIDGALQHEQQWVRGFGEADVEVIRRVLKVIIGRGRAPHPFLD